MAMLRTFRNSILVGIGFMLATLSVLLGIEVVDWWHYDFFDLNYIYEKGGIPCLGIFSIAAASFFVSDVLPTRFTVALLLVSVCTIGCWAIGGGLDATPHMYKSENTIHWMRITVLLWLMIPPWLTAFCVTAFRGSRRTSIRHPTDSGT